MKYRVRSGVLILKDGKILLYQRPAGYWYFPGGGIEHGETAERCAVRETMEETGLKIKVGRLLYVRKWKHPNRWKHGEKRDFDTTVELVHLARPVGGKLRPGVTKEDIDRTACIRWLGLEEASRVWFLSPDLLKIFRRDLKSRFKGCPRWLGETRLHFRA
ncbi:MAG: NUDIX domain-containing protein [Candidatus Aenigmatarchaeota archaeon]